MRHLLLVIITFITATPVAAGDYSSYHEVAEYETYTYAYPFVPLINVKTGQGPPIIQNVTTILQQRVLSDSQFETPPWRQYPAVLPSALRQPILAGGPMGRQNLARPK